MTGVFIPLIYQQEEKRKRTEKENSEKRLQLIKSKTSSPDRVQKGRTARIGTRKSVRHLSELLTGNQRRILQSALT